MKALQPCTVSEDVEVRWVGLRSSEGWAPEPTGFIFIYLITLYKYLDYIHITWITICQTSTIFQHSVQLCMAKAVLQIFGTDLQPAGVLDRSFCSFHWYLCDFYALWYTLRKNNIEHFDFWLSACGPRLAVFWWSLEKVLENCFDGFDSTLKFNSDPCYLKTSLERKGFWSIETNLEFGNVERQPSTDDVKHKA